MTKKIVPNEEPTRLARIMNPRVRQWGIDLDALAQQVREKREKLQAMSEAESEYAKLALEYDKMALDLQTQLDDRRRQYMKEIEDFRKTQTRDATREFDLNDPKGLWKDRPAREGDDDPRCGPASLQKFAGEDPEAAARRLAQQQRLRQDLAAQMAHKQAMAQAEAEELAMLRETVRALDALQLELTEFENSRRRDMNRQTREANEQLSDEVRRRREAERQAEKEANERELNHLTFDPWLSEDPSTTLNTRGTARKDNFKGMSDEELRAIREIQEAQIRAKEERKRAEKDDEIAYVRQLNSMVRTLDDMEYKRQQFLRQQAAQSAEILKRQMEEKKARDGQLNETYRNRATDDFFNQFGRSHR